jgi:L-Ala-D/L-Glu epimerase
VIINDLELFLVDMRCDDGEPWPATLVRLSTDRGHEGWGEARIPWRPEDLATRRDILLSVLAGRNPFDIEELLTLRALRDPSLRSALEMASWDLVGRIVGQPLCNLIGGRYRQRIALAVRIGDPPQESVVPIARELASQGFHWQVLCSHGQAERDWHMVRQVREQVGHQVQLRLDAAGLYTFSSARGLCSDMEPEGLQFLIDPLRSDESHQMAALARHTTVPLAAWRSVTASSDVLDVVRSGSASSVIVDLQLVGGITAARRCAAVAQAGHLAAMLAGKPSLGIATAAMLHLAAATPALSSCNECAASQFQDDILAEPLEIMHGMMAVPQGPGLGVEIDRAKLEHRLVEM